MNNLLMRMWYWLLGKSSEETFLTKIPEEAVPYLNKKLKQENARLKVENIKLRSKIKEKDIVKEQKKRQKQLSNEILADKRKQELWEKEGRIALRLVTKKLPVFTLKNNQTYYKFKLWGFLLKDNGEGHLLIQPILVNGSKKVVFNAVAFTFKEIFKNNLNLVHQLRSGRIDTNFEVINNKPKLTRSFSIDSESGEKVKIIHLEENEKLKYERTINNLLQELGGMEQQLTEQKQKEVSYVAEINKSKSQAEIANKERDVISSGFSNLLNKVKNMTLELVNLSSEMQDSKVSEISIQKLNMSLLGILDKYNDIIKERIPADAQAEANAQTKERMNEALETIQKVQKTMNPPPPKRGLFSPKKAEGSE